MVKLQKIVRANGSIVSSVNLPIDLVEQLDWNKGDDIHVAIEVKNNIKTIILWKEDISEK